MNTYQDILKKYWGYASFRPSQEEIIHSIMNGSDTLGLLPTGGGKSITFQVPAIAKEGICIVITPLIALMKDQVENLKKRGIKSIAIHSGLSKEEIDLGLDNAIYGNYKFLYISPERLSTELFKARIQKMPVNLLTIDEAHCISQWGYDFRPSYLNIAKVREIIPDIPCLALTATATPEVVEDIQEKLGFRKKNVIKSSFERQNLAYLVRYEEDKYRYIVHTTGKTRGSGIIYVRNRKNTRELALLLKKSGFAADYYHAGLNHELRSLKQEEWTKGKTRIMVSTNAFGMGIDKPDVRFVIHFDVPDNLESYFQEAGRAGRDLKKSSAVLLFNDTDVVKLKKRAEVSFPAIEEIKRVYAALCNYLQIPVGSAKGIAFDFNIGDFCSAFHLNVLLAYNCLKFLEREGYIELTDELNSPSRVYFKVSRDDLYKFQIANPEYDTFIKLMLRSYTGLFNDFVNINETVLSKRAGMGRDKIYDLLKKLQQTNMISYIPQKKTPLIIFTEERLDEKTLRISTENYLHRKNRYMKRLQAMENYATSRNTCRSIMLLHYFGESKTEPCGHCDFCVAKRDNDITNYEYEIIYQEIEKTLHKNELLLNELIDKIMVPKEKAIKIIQWMLDEEIIIYAQNKNLIWKGSKS